MNSRVQHALPPKGFSGRIKATAALADPSRYGRSDRSAAGRWFWEIDRVLLLLIAVLIGIGLIAVAAASPAAAQRYSGGIGAGQRAVSSSTARSMWIAVSLPVMILHLDDAARARAPLRDRRRAVFLVLLAVVPFIGAEKNGAVRWIELGVGQLQPSEFLKPFFVVAMAWLLSLQGEGQGAAGVPAVGRC